MADGRFVVLGLATARSSWFRDVSRWSTTAVLPIEFVKAMSVEEVRARLRAGRAHSAVLVEGSVPALDRDLIDLARERGCAVIVVRTGRARRDWLPLGASAVLDEAFTPDDLLHVLAQVATPVAREAHGPLPPPEPRATAGFRGRLVAVTGGGGTGASTTAIALTQHLARDVRYAGHACLADLSLHGEQAMLHGSPDVVPGVLELVDAHRGGQPHLDSVLDVTWQVPERGYRLLLGLRRHRDWTALRPRALEASLDSLRRAFRVVVADTDCDLEGEAETGSMDLEERNGLARATIGQADAVVIVGRPGMKGLHGLLRCVRDVTAFGVPVSRVLPVINAAPRRARARTELAEAFAQLVGESVAGDVAAPVYLGPNRQLEARLLDGAALPDGWAAALGHAVLRALDGAGEDTAWVEPVRIQPGTLGTWTDQEEVAAGEAG